MKRLLYIAVIFLALLYSCSNSNPTEKENRSPDTTITVNSVVPASVDSIIIYDSIAANPLLIEYWDVSINEVLDYLPAGAKALMKIEPTPSDPSVNDSIWTILFGHSTFEYRKGSALGYISYISLTDNSVPLKRNIKIGETYESVVNKIPGLTGKQFDKVYIKSGDAENTLILIFQDSKLKEVIFCPYMG